MSRKGEFISILFGNLDSPVSDARVCYQEDRCVANGVDAFVTAWYQIWIMNRHCVQLPIVEANEKSSIFLGK